MSENIASPVRPRKSRIKLLVIILSVLILLLVYGAGIVLLPVKILTSYRDRNCDSVLSLNKMYTALYPTFIEDGSLSIQVQECDAYVSAVTKEQNEEWNDAYQAYQAYSTEYANGLYAKEAYEHSASALIHVIEDQAEEKSYESAIENLNLIITSYSDTAASTDAWTLTPSVYTSWGTDLRGAGDFESAEHVLNDFKSWSEHYQRNEAVPQAKAELAKTYIAWGLALQAKKDFESAVAKFELAAKTDPQAQPDSEPVTSVKAAQRKVYMEWGKALLEEKDFSGAIKKFELAVSYSDNQNEDGVSDALSKAYMQWSNDLRTSEDYFGALEQLEKANQSALAEATKQSVEAAYEETYLAFSNSRGSQAKQAMKEALETVCKQKKKPTLPIFGLNKDSVHVGVYGAEASLPETLAAKSPGEMHYVACIEAASHTIDSRYQRYIIQRTSRGYYYTVIHQLRAEVLWNINLLKTDSRESVAKGTLAGGTPPPFPSENVDTVYFHGPPPTIAEFVAWLESVMK